MQFSIKYKKRAVELYEEHTANEVFQILSTEYPDKGHPNEKTLIRWSGSEKFEAAKEVILEELKKPVDPIIAEKRKEHYAQLADIASAILGELKNVGIQIGSRHASNGLEIEDQYEIDRVLDAGTYISMPINQSEIIKALHTSIEDVYDRYRENNLYSYFCKHLEYENSAFSDIHQAAKYHPIELIELLKLLCLKKTFQGKCKVCEDW